MKTAIQELIELIENGETRLDLIENHKQIWLEKEKEQIIKAHIDGFDHIVVDFKKQEYAEQYYNETYKQ